MKKTMILKIPILSEKDIVETRQKVWLSARDMGFGITDVTKIVTATSELVRNIYKYAGEGLAQCMKVEEQGKIGIELVFEDQGPGIPNIEKYVQEGFTTGKGMGMGLAGSRKLMDEMDIKSKVNTGTKVTIRKWMKAT